MSCELKIENREKMVDHAPPKGTEAKRTDAGGVQTVRSSNEHPMGEAHRREAREQRSDKKPDGPSEPSDGKKRGTGIRKGRSFAKGGAARPALEGKGNGEHEGRR